MAAVCYTCYRPARTGLRPAVNRSNTRTRRAAPCVPPVVVVRAAVQAAYRSPFLPPSLPPTHPLARAILPPPPFAGTTSPSDYVHLVLRIPSAACAATPSLWRCHPCARARNRLVNSGAWPRVIAAQSSRKIPEKRIGERQVSSSVREKREASRLLHPPLCPAPPPLSLGFENNSGDVEIRPLLPRLLRYYVSIWNLSDSMTIGESRECASAGVVHKVSLARIEFLRATRYPSYSYHT